MARIEKARRVQHLSPVPTVPRQAQALNLPPYHWDLINNTFQSGFTTSLSSFDTQGHEDQMFSVRTHCKTPRLTFFSQERFDHMLYSLVTSSLTVIPKWLPTFPTGDHTSLYPAAEQRNPWSILTALGHYWLASTWFNALVPFTSVLASLSNVTGLGWRGTWRQWPLIQGLR